MHRQYLVFLIVLITDLISITGAHPFGKPTVRPLTSLTNVPDYEDVGIQPAGPPGSSLSKRSTILFFHIMSLEIYQQTVLAGGNAALPQPEWERKWGGLKMSLHSYPNSGTTWADALFALHTILRQMLDPGIPTGFRGQVWGVGRKEPGKSWDTGKTVASIILGPTPKHPSFDGSSSTLSIATEPKASSSSFTSGGALTAPFPVPESDMTLLVGARGEDLTEIAVVLGLDEMIRRAWRNLAINGRPQPVETGTMRLSGIGDDVFWVVVRPRMNGATSLMTETDFVETAVGIVYYMVLNGFFATKITAVRRESSGKRAVKGEIELSVTRPRIGALVSGNASLIRTD